MAVLINYYPIDESLQAGHHRSTRDVIRLSINGVIIEHPVTEGEAASKDPIKIIIYQKKWEEIGSGERVCEYEVVDETGNYSLGWSPMQIISVYLKDATPPLPKPFIEDTNNDGEVDLDELNGTDATIVVYVRDRDYLPRDLIQIQAEGRTEDHVIIKKSYEYEVLSVPRDARIPLPFEDLWPLVKGSLRLRYERIRAGVTPNRSSQVEVVNIIGTGNSKGLPPPLVLEAPDGNLKPDSATVTVRIEPFTGQTAFASIKLKLVGTLANGTGYYREVGPRPAGSGPITIRLINGPEGEIAKLEGGTLEISYIVTPEKPGPSRESQSIHLEIGDIVASLPAPMVEEAPPPDFVYNPEVSKYGATIVARKNAAFTLDSIVTLHFEGSVAGGSAKPQPFKITQNWLNEDLYFFVDQLTVEKNKNYSARIYYTLSKEYERTRFSHALIMKVGAPLNLPEPEVLQATVINPGKATMNPAHVLTPALFTIRVRYSPMLDTHQINVDFMGAIGLGTPYIPSQSGNSAQGFVDFNVSNTAVAANLEGTCTVKYEVVSADGKTPSKELTLEVQPLPSSLLNVVSIPEAVGGVIDANRKNNVLTLDYPFMGLNQEYFINLKSQSNRLLTGKVSPEEFTAKRIVKEIPADYLPSQPNGSDVTVEVRVSLNGVGDLNSATRLGVPPPYKIKKAIGIINHIDVGGTPIWLVTSPNGKFLYVTNNTTHSVSVIDTTTDKVIHTITGLNGPYSLAVHPDGSLLYVGNLGDKTVSIFSTADYKELLPRIPGFNAPHGIVINDRATRMYVTCNADGYIYVHDVASRGRLSSIKILYPTGIALNPSNSRLYIADYSRVSILDTSTNQLVGTGIPGFNYPRDIAYSPHNIATPRAYLTNQNSNNVIIVNAGTNIAHKTLSGFLQPYGVAINPVIEHAYITENTGNSLKIIDVNTEEVIDTFTGLNQPRGVAVLPNGSKFYVANAGGHTVTVFSA
ncbi:YncE family protein [Pseudomonas sp. P9_2]|uniref:YncE family protein n=1 Tax=Pseudomonas sp. P9_2 TaxID=3043447 RepID=UPI002A36B01F|nr:YncE family protein [Pseudomonas sp. P9_2]WPN52562.1 YncE family protein [Pseudomonas sp. P9_2]